MKTKLAVKFGCLEHGWYPITVSTIETVVEIDASDVPVNPVEQLTEALEKCFIGGESSEAWMHLEPNYYKWSLSCDRNSATLKLYYVEEFSSITIPENREQRETLKLEYEGECKDVLFPIWLGIKEFISGKNGYDRMLHSLDRKVKEIKKRQQTHAIDRACGVKTFVCS